jgi:DNA replication protein DnaC
MLATAIGYQAVEAGYRCYYTTAADLVARTQKAALRAAGKRRCGSGTARS